MVRAHTRKAIDYSTFDPLNFDHVIRERFVLGEEYSELVASTCLAGLQSTAATMIAGAVLKQEAPVRESSSKLVDLYNGFMALTLPWAQVRWADDIRNVANELVKWERVFGRLNSPEVVEKLRKYEAIAGPPAPTGTSGWERVL